MGIFDGLTGQQAVKEKLACLPAGGTPGHAHLFAGPAGLGKRTFARAYASALLCICETGGEDDGPPCGKCISCRLLRGGALDDYMYIEPTGQGQKPVIPVDSIRRVVDWFSIRPLYSRHKTCVIAQADHMTEQAQNALLKTLEEPPAYGVIILTASNTGALLETVRSRCVTTGFSGYTDAEFETILLHSGEFIQESVIPTLAKLSGRNPGYALDLARSGSFLSDRDELIGLFCGFLEGDAVASYQLSSFLLKNRDGFFKNAGILVYWLRDIWLGSVNTPDELRAGGADIVNSDMKRRLFAFCGRFHPEALLDSIINIEETCLALSGNANYSLAVNAMLFKINGLLLNHDDFTAANIK